MTTPDPRDLVERLRGHADWLDIITDDYAAGSTEDRWREVASDIRSAIRILARAERAEAVGEAAREAKENFVAIWKLALPEEGQMWRIPSFSTSEAAHDAIGDLLTALSAYEDSGEG